MEKIMLTKNQIKLLKAYKKGIRLPENRTEKDVNKLLREGLIYSQGRTNVSETGVIIHGVDYIFSDKGDLYFKIKHMNFYQFISNEIRGWITIAIAVAAFIISIISLIRI